jgi:transcriptional regulator with XRE-family HTH domain
MTHASEISPLGLVLKSYRVRRGWSQRTLGLKAGLGNGSYGHIERGRRQPAVPTLKRILTALGVDWRSFGEDMQARDPLAHEERLVAP